MQRKAEMGDTERLRGEGQAEMEAETGVACLLFPGTLFVAVRYGRHRKRIQNVLL